MYLPPCPGRGCPEGQARLPQASQQACRPGAGLAEPLQTRHGGARLPCRAALQPLHIAQSLQQAFQGTKGPLTHQATLDAARRGRRRTSTSSPCAAMSRCMTWRWCVVSLVSGALPLRRCLPSTARRSAPAAPRRSAYMHAWVSDRVRVGAAAALLALHHTRVCTAAAPRRSCMLWRGARQTTRCCVLLKHSKAEAPEQMPRTTAQRGARARQGAGRAPQPGAHRRRSRPLRRPPPARQPGHGRPHLHPATGKVQDSAVLGAVVRRRRRPRSAPRARRAAACCGQSRH